MNWIYKNGQFYAILGYTKKTWSYLSYILCCLYLFRMPFNWIFITKNEQVIFPTQMAVICLLQTCSLPFMHTNIKTSTKYRHIQYIHTHIHTSIWKFHSWRFEILNTTNRNFSIPWWYPNLETFVGKCWMNINKQHTHTHTIHAIKLVV